MLVVEAVRLDLGMRKKQALTREQLALSIRAVNNMARTLRKSGTDPGRSGNKGDGNNATSNMLYLEPLDQRALKVEIAAAEVTRSKHYYACRRLRRAGTVLSARQKRLEATLTFLTEGVRGTLLTLERIMGQLRKQLALARIQERVFHEEVVKADRKGLKARRRLAVVTEQLVALELHPHKVWPAYWVVCVVLRRKKGTHHEPRHTLDSCVERGTGSLHLAQTLEIHAARIPGAR